MATILIVDDSATECLLLATLLGGHGFQTLSAASGEESIDLAREHVPDLILMDVVMPGLNGFQATRALSKDPRTAAIPIIIVTSKSQETDRLWALKQGATDYLVKPVVETELLAKIESALHGKGQAAGPG